MTGTARVLAAARVRSALLGPRRATSHSDAVGRMLAIQSQEHQFARWSVAQRTARPDDSAMLAALDTGAVIRTHLLRPTWHYVRGEDLRWLQALTGPRVRRLSAGWYRNHGADEEFLATTRRVVERALAKSGALTRDELRSELQAAGVDVSGQRLAAAMFDLELTSVVCSGPVREKRGGAGPGGRQHTYALVEERLAPTAALSEEEATSELVRRYLVGHAPATLKDLRWWSTLTLDQLRRGVAALGEAVVSERVGDTEYLWLAADPPDGDGPSEEGFELLQVFDELFVGYAETRSLLDPDGEFGPVLPIGYTKMMHVVLEGDALVGRWRSDRRGDGLTLTFDLKRPLSREDVSRLERAAVAYGAFVGKEATVALLSPSTR